MERAFSSQGDGRGHQGPQRLKDLPKASQLVGRGASSENQALRRGRLLSAIALDCSDGQKQVTGPKRPPRASLEALRSSHQLTLLSEAG